MPTTEPHLDLMSLSPIHRALLATDGTLTEILEALFLEPIELVKCAGPDGTPVRAHPALNCGDGEMLLLRRILLRGARTRTNYVYAESSIATERLPQAFQAALTSSNVPIGRLFLKFKLETFKEILEIREGHQKDATAFGWPTTRCLSRTYRVTSGGRPIMIISEHFPVTLVPPSR